MKNRSLIPLSILSLLVFQSCGEKESISSITKPIVVSTEEIEEEVVEEPEPEPLEIVNIPEPEAKPAPLSFMENALLDRTIFVNGEQIRHQSIEGKPDYYVVFLTAAWSAKCKENIGEIKRLYEEHIVTNPQIEFLMVSVDSESQWVHKWAVEEKFPWPMLMKDQLDGISEIKEMGDLYAHVFALFDKEGNNMKALTLETFASEVSRIKGETAKLD